MGDVIYAKPRFLNRRVQYEKSKIQKSSELESDMNLDLNDLAEIMNKINEEFIGDTGDLTDRDNKEIEEFVNGFGGVNSLRRIPYVNGRGLAKMISIDNFRRIIEDNLDWITDLPEESLFEAVSNLRRQNFSNFYIDKAYDCYGELMPSHYSIYATVPESD